MAYTITLSNGSLLTTVADDTIDSTTSISLVGRSYLGYGQAIAENFVHMLENFADTTPPNSPLTGELWYDSTTGALNVYNGITWNPVAGNTGITQPPNDHSTFLATTAFVRTAGRYSFDVSSPPASPFALVVGDILTVTFTGVPTIPLHVATSQGIYKATLVIRANNSTNCDISWQPNDTNYAGAFNQSGIEVADQELTAFGTATGFATLTPKTVSPYLGSIPVVPIFYAQNHFGFDLFFGPTTTPDNINDIGPSMVEFLVSTYTNAKMIKGSSGIAGGPAISFSRWADSSTAWTSLGTLSDNFGSSLSGVMVVERIV